MFKKDPPFKIEEAFYQKWAAGIKEGGSGINIHIQFAEMEPNVLVQNIYFREHILEAKGSVNTPKNFTAHLNNNSKPRNLVMDSDPLKEAKNTPYAEFPFQLEKNEAVVSYWFEGERSYYKIHSLSEKKAIAYPQALPQQ